MKIVESRVCIADRCLQLGANLSYPSEILTLIRQLGHDMGHGISTSQMQHVAAAADENLTY